jgi:Domain of unknown function (DUF4112)
MNVILPRKFGAASLRLKSRLENGGISGLFLPRRQNPHSVHDQGPFSELSSGAASPYDSFMADEAHFEIIAPSHSAPPELPPPLVTPEQMAILLQVENIARFMDSAVNIPGINRRVGADAFIGIILPGIGDVAAALVATYIVALARKLGLPPQKLAKMVMNILVDTGVGAVPVAGDLFDLAIKANLKNANLIRAHFRLPPLPRR